ncbi:hypothetical protein S83_011290 [Arachis hypogaea]
MAIHHRSSSIKLKEGSMRIYCHIMMFLFLLAPRYCYSPSTAVTESPLLPYKVPTELNVKEPWVIEMMNFALKEYNKKAKVKLKLKQPLTCLAVSAPPRHNLYALQFLANDGVETRKYAAQLIQDMSSSTFWLGRFAVKFL